MARLTFQTTSEITAIYDGKFSGIAANTPITTRTTNRAITLTYRQKIIILKFSSVTATP